MFDASIIEKSEQIEEFLEDDLSREVFRYRLLANLSNDVRYIHTLLKKTGLIDFRNAYGMWKKIEENYGIYPRYDVLSFLQKRDKKKDVVLFGAGHDSLIYISLLDAAGITPTAILDNYTTKNISHGIRVYRPADYPFITESTVVITSKKNFEAMYWELRARGVPKEQIFIPDDNALYVFSQREYFDADIWKGLENEIYVDAGAYNLATVLEFIRFSKSYEKIIAFEPDSKNMELCRNAQDKSKIENLEMIPMGLWDSDTELYFRRGGDNGTGTSVSESDEDAICVPVRSLDSVLDGQRCTFIKMDIEGSELMALKGAQKTIRNYKPRLAICLYHKPMDLIDIPLFIKETVPEYKIRIRHYSTWFFDTVLYADVNGFV